MSTDTGKETLHTILETWCAFADTEADGTNADKTYRLDDLFLDDDEELDLPEPQWPGHTVVGEVGKGGMGVVHRASQDLLQRMVALKTPNHPQLHRRFTEEALISGYLNHPNIIAVHNLLRGADHALGLTMPLIDGVSWDKQLKADYAQHNNRLPNHLLHDHLDALIKVCQAVSYAHHKGILHNDLKLENVMVGAFGDVVVMDWGCATHNPTVETEIPFDILHPKSIQRPFGSPSYMPPELAYGRGEQIGPWTDTYLLGAMLYEILEGHPPRRGQTLGQVIELACLGEFESFTRCSSAALQAICEKALSADISERYQNPEELETVLRGYFRVEQSEKLLATVESVLQAEQSITYSDTSGALVTLIEAVSMTQQAHEIWPSDAAKNLRTTATRRLVERALEMGDLELATAYIEQLPTAHDDLRQSLANKQRLRQEETNAVDRNKRLSRLVVVLMILGLSAGGFFINRSRQAAIQQRRIAEDRLLEITSLADIQSIQQLKSEVDSLWPLRDHQIANMERWINQAERLTNRKTLHLKHQQALSKNDMHMDTQLLQWEQGIVSSLLSEIDAFEAALIPDIKARREMALSLPELSITQHQAMWNKAIQSIQSLPIYDGLTLTPQLGLVPLRQDPKSGLWEFVHIQSGSPPVIENDQYIRTPDTGIILVLLPGSQFWMGAQTDGSRNVDPRAKETEGPVHLVDIAPFFLSKYELNQAQWTRIAQTNPAAYPVGTEVKPQSVTELHPIEQVTWAEATSAVQRYDLQLPTEAQWEYAARGRWTEKGQTPPSNPVFWTGNRVSSLQGTLNIADMGGRQLGSPESWRFESVLNDGHIVHAPVGSFAANPFGLHDMLGNVWEWCADRFGEYTLPTEPGTGKRLAPEDASNLFRGGGFRASSVHVRSADRYSIYATDYSAYDVGFRPARAIETTP